MGGNAPIYLSNLMIRFDDNTKLTDDKEFGINGNFVDLGLVKSRTNRAGGDPATLVFNQEEGYDPLLSLFILLKQNNLVNGAGVGMYLGDRNDMKFSQKTFKKKLSDNPELQELFTKTVYQLLTGFLKRDEIVNKDIENTIDDLIMNKLQLM